MAEPASPAKAGAGCLSGPVGLGGKIYGITSLGIIPAYNLETEAVDQGVAVEIPIVQPVAVFEDNIEEAVNDDADFWDEIGGPEVPIFQEVVDQSEFIRQRVRVQIREYRLLPPMAMKVDLGGKKEFSNPLDWWRDNQYQFNLLALLARRNLCIPSTSAPS